MCKPALNFLAKTCDILVKYKKTNQRFALVLSKLKIHHIFLKKALTKKEGSIALS